MLTIGIENLINLHEHTFLWWICRYDDVENQPALFQTLSWNGKIHVQNFTTLCGLNPKHHNEPLHVARILALNVKQYLGVPLNDRIDKQTWK